MLIEGVAPGLPELHMELHLRDVQTFMRMHEEWTAKGDPDRASVCLYLAKVYYRSAMSADCVRGTA
jgi:hypothetical protein